VMVRVRWHLRPHSVELWLRTEVHLAIGSGELPSSFSVRDNCNRTNQVIIPRIPQITPQICDSPWN